MNDEARETRVVDALWEALKQECCKNPAEAKTIVFLGEEKFRKVVGPLLQQPAPSEWCIECGHDGPRNEEGRCMVEISAYSDPERGNQKWCTCKCVFATTGPTDAAEFTDVSDTSPIQSRDQDTDNEADSR